MKNRDLSRILLVLLLFLGLIYLVSNDQHETVNKQLKQELQEEKKLFKEVLSKKDNEIEQLTKKVTLLEQDIALQETNK